MIRNIFIATDDDIIQFGNDVNINTVYLSRVIIIWGNCLNCLEKTIVSDHIFCQYLLPDLGTHLWPLSVRVHIFFIEIFDVFFTFRHAASTRNSWGGMRKLKKTPRHFNQLSYEIRYVLLC